MRASQGRLVGTTRLNNAVWLEELSICHSLIRAFCGLCASASYTAARDQALSWERRHASDEARMG